MCWTEFQKTYERAWKRRKMSDIVKGDDYYDAQNTEDDK